MLMLHYIILLYYIDYKQLRKFKL